MTTATLQAFSYFPSMVYRDEHPEWVGYLLQTCQKHYEWMQNNRPEEEKSWPVLQTAHMANDPELKFLVDYLLESARVTLQDQGYDTDKYEFYLSGLWGQDVKCHGSTNVHVHKHSQICGWVFLETPENGSYPIFYDTRKNKEMMELDFAQGNDILNATSSIHFNSVVPGTVLFANSWMQHQLTPSQSEKQTKTIHFIVSHREKTCSTC